MNMLSFGSQASKMEKAGETNYGVLDQTKMGFLACKGAARNL